VSAPRPMRTFELSLTSRRRETMTQGARGQRDLRKPRNARQRPRCGCSKRTSRLLQPNSSSAIKGAPGVASLRPWNERSGRSVGAIEERSERVPLVVSEPPASSVPGALVSHWVGPIAAPPERISVADRFPFGGSVSSGFSPSLPKAAELAGPVSAAPKAGSLIWGRSPAEARGLASLREGGSY
jgi:hypothetical protein